MPRINTQRLAEQRQWRRNQLIEAAASIAMESGAGQITVAAVATRAGLSRTSVYEYFESSSELVADLIMDELKNFADYLSNSVKDCQDPNCVITCWIESALSYVADGRHLLAKALNVTSTPQSRAEEISRAHRSFMVPLIKAVEQLGVGDVPGALSFIQAVSDAATKRIESGHNPESEISNASAFCINGLKGL